MSFARDESTSYIPFRPSVRAQHGSPNQDTTGNFCLHPRITRTSKWQGVGGLPTPQNSALVILAGTTSTCHRWIQILPTALLGQGTAGCVRWVTHKLGQEGTRLVFISPEAMPEDLEGV